MATIKTKEEWYAKNKQWHSLRTEMHQLHEEIDVLRAVKPKDLTEYRAMLEARLNGTAPESPLVKRLNEAHDLSRELKRQLDEFDDEYKRSWYGWWRI